MTTLLLLGLLSAAAVGATRAVVGAPADDAVDATTVDADVSGDGDATPSTTKRATAKAKKPSANKGSKRSTSEPRRAGGAVSPSDALHLGDADSEAP